MDSIEAYKPNPSAIAKFSLDEALDDKALAFEGLKKLVLARKTQDVVFLAIGKLLKLFKERQLYKQLDFETFGQFLASEELSFSSEKAYMCIRVYEHYSEYLGMDENMMRDFPIVRLSLMLPVLKKIESKEEQIAEIERVKALRHNDFIKEYKTITNTDGRPNVYFSNEANKWIVNYYENTTALVSLGDYAKDSS